MRTRPALAALSLLAASAPAANGGTPGFAGRLLVVASDGDMQAQAYAGDSLGPPARDLLSIIRLDAGSPRLAGSVEVPNSVIGPPASLAVTPDGRYAILVETRGPRPTNRPDARLEDLPPGRTITIVDLRDPDRPRVTQRTIGRAGPISVSVRPDGAQVAIAYDTAGRGGAALDLYTFANGRLGSGRSPAIPGFAPGDALKNAAYAPDGALALVYATRPRLSMLRSTADGWLARWGNDVPLGPTPFEVRFTPDGRFAFVNDMTVPATGTDVRGTVTAIALDAGRASDGSPMHRVVSQARTGVLPEGLTVSPDGRWFATTNLERTAYRADDPHQGLFASVTLLRFDARTGALIRVGDYPFAGVIPEAAAFDNSSRFLAVTSFDHLRPLPSRGSVDVWRIVGDFQDPDRVELAPTGLSIPVPRGAQSMEVVR